jgi:hypothetical protein
VIVFVFVFVVVFVLWVIWVISVCCESGHSVRGLQIKPRSVASDVFQFWRTDTRHNPIMPMIVAVAVVVVSF